MTLKEKFQEEKIYINAYSFKLTKESAEKYEQIADEFAIGFAEWFDYLKDNHLHKLGVYEFDKQYGSKTYKELLEIYKIEKGL